jgi:hypothetical protein
VVLPNDPDRHHHGGHYTAYQHMLLLGFFRLSQINPACRSKKQKHQV